MISISSNKRAWPWIGMLIVLSAASCTQDGDFWNLGRRNPNDPGLNVNPEDDRLPLIRTVEVAPNEGVWRAELRSEGERPMELVGWVWTEDGSAPLYPDHDFVVSDRVELGLHEVAVPDGFCNSDVRVRAFAVNQFGTAHGAVLSYQGDSTTATADWSMAAVTSTTTSTITAAATLALSNCVTVQEIGLCWSFSAEPTTADATIPLGQTAGLQEAVLTGLAPAETVYLRFYAVTSLGIQYSLGLSAQTLSVGPPTVTTGSAVDIQGSTAVLQGTVVDDGGSPITDRGFYLAVQPNPGPGDAILSAAAGTGFWTTAAENLTGNTTYHFRAFATNVEGTSTGDVQSFTTPDVPIPSPISPIDGTTVNCCFFYLDWSCVDGATGYEIQMSTSSDFSGDPVGMPESPGGALSVNTTMSAAYDANCFSGEQSSPQMSTGSGATSGQTFYWRVRAILGGTTGPWSPTASFQYTF